MASFPFFFLFFPFSFNSSESRAEQAPGRWHFLLFFFSPKGMHFSFVRGSSWSWRLVAPQSVSISVLWDVFL